MNAIVDISKVVLETERLILRPWNEKDLEDFTNMHRSMVLVKWQDGVRINQLMNHKLF